MLIFVRHGETIWKTEGKTQGQLDSPLTGKGKKQAMEFAERNEGAFQGLTNIEQKRKYPELFDKKGKMLNEDKIPMAESMSSFLKRIKEGIDKYQCSKITYLVVSHSGVLQGIKIFQNRIHRNDFGESTVDFLESLTYE